MKYIILLLVFYTFSVGACTEEVKSGSNFIKAIIKSDSVEKGFCPWYTLVLENNPEDIGKFISSASIKVMDEKGEVLTVVPLTMKDIATGFMQTDFCLSNYHVKHSQIVVQASHKASVRVSETGSITVPVSLCPYYEYISIEKALDEFKKSPKTKSTKNP